MSADDIQKRARQAILELAAPDIAERDDEIERLQSRIMELEAALAAAEARGAERARDDIRRNERRRCVAFIHDYAARMNDPSARAALNTCADSLGKARALTDGPDPAPSGKEPGDG